MVNWHARPFKGPVKLIYYGPWGQEAPVVSKVVDSPTYATLYRLADDLIKRSGDKHHLYITCFKQVPHKHDAHLKDYQLIRLGTGS